LRVQWSNSFSESFRISNGVKQGGVLSPLLFTVYIDTLLSRLKTSSLGCHVGVEFCGAFGYADDIILLSPSRYGLKRMLDICTKYAYEYNVLFNPTKSKLILLRHDKKCGQSNSNIPCIRFMNGYLEVVQKDMHLGNLIGNVTQEEIISRSTNEFRARVNMVKTHFKWLPTDVMYHIFKTYCMPLYGSQLWDLNSSAINKFYVAWRKSIRYVLNLPRTTHCSLLPLICNDISISNQMSCRFLNFFRSLSTSSNYITRYCTKLALGGSRSSVSNNLSYLSEVCRRCRYDLAYISCVDTIPFFPKEYHTADCVNASLIRDLLSTKFNNTYIPSHEIFLQSTDIDCMIEVLCCT